MKKLVRLLLHQQIKRKWKGLDETIKEAEKYFGKNVDIYINGGKKIGKPSTLIRVLNDKIEVLRQGVIKIKI